MAHPDPPLTMAQKHYLEAFDAFLKAQGPWERLEARESMAVRLNFVLAEANLGLPDSTRWTDQRKAA